jgi:hypothetical protein
VPVCLSVCLCACLQVAQAPNVRAATVQRLAELDSDIGSNAMPVGTDGIDLSLLSSVLTPAEKIHETDHAWDFDSLFTSAFIRVHTRPYPVHTTARCPPHSVAVCVGLDDDLSRTIAFDCDGLTPATALLPD